MFGWEYLKGRDRLEDIHVGRRLVLGMNLKLI